MHPVIQSFFSVVLFIGTCSHPSTDKRAYSANLERIGALAIVNSNTIPLPEGFRRIAMERKSFGEWLRDYPFAKSEQVFLFNGEPSPNQSMQYRVLDLSIGSQNLQQCADAIMRLRAEYYFEHAMYDAIRFPARGVVFAYTDYLKGIRYRLSNNNLITVPGTEKRLEPGKASLHEFLQIVFAYCGTYSIYEASERIDATQVNPGDMLIKPGSPGHAMIVMDIAIQEETGKRIAVLAQGFMPAQSVHVVKNVNDHVLSPWYLLQAETIVTPGYNFDTNCWYRWK